ncbi:MAG: hypothetical protein F9K21_10670 [Rhodocyclaceae bacterium]|nr:MAG: hypothetical protein F9K21_10670 [Rhodocyclaceae bacterium]
MKSRHDPSEIRVNSMGHPPGFGCFGQQCCSQSNSNGFASICFRFYFLSLLSLIVAIQGCGMKNDAFNSEIAQIPRPTGKDRVDISDVVKKHIPPGTDLQSAFTYLKDRGFNVTPHKEKNLPLGQLWFLAEKEESQKVILAERTRIIIQSDGEYILEIRGWIFLIGI